MAAGLGTWRCSAYCYYPINIGSVSCHLNETRLPHHAVTPEDASRPLFNPHCWCLSPDVLNYTPRCIWCLGLFKIAPAAADLLRNAFDLCVSEPLNFKPCPSDCGVLHKFEETGVVPCIKQAKAAGVEDPEKACWCTKTAQSLVTNCWFCMYGWNQTESLATKAKLDVCGGVFRNDPGVTSSGVPLVRPATSTIAAPARATGLPAIVTASAQNKTVSKRLPPLPVYVSASAVVSGPRGGPAEGYYDTRNTAIVRLSGSRRPSIVWWSCPIVAMTILLSFCNYF
ncbi:MAG: hypothetical protein M1840_008036 [Geoglossum simile]|nr:MAG: hypothetical protein M1840_008036 [Geoglossum simile]